LIIGALSFYGSPIIVGAVFWFKRSRRKSRTRAEADAQAARELSELASREEAAERERIAELERDRLRRKFLERQRLLDSVDRHRSALKRNLQRAVSENDYGKVTSDNRHKAIEEFVASVDIDVSVLPYDEIVELIFEQLSLKKAQDLSAGFDVESVPSDGHAFEEWVAEALVGYGWTAKVTRGSGDQGIDVIAERADKRLGFQCKLYSAPVGNKAVQEAHAGKLFYGLDGVGVISSSGFTRSAKDLALMTGVGLFLHSDIPTLHEKLLLGV